MGYEFLQIRNLEDGRIAYIALPSGKAETIFPLVRMGPREVVFENPAHDFPQRILYLLGSRGRLLARIEGLVEGKPMALDFPMRRVRCGSRPARKP